MSEYDSIIPIFLPNYFSSYSNAPTSSFVKVNAQVALYKIIALILGRYVNFGGFLRNVV
jgi:hypothetical protein